MNWRVRKSTHRPAVSLPDGQPSLLLQSTRGDWQQNFLQRQVLWTSPDGAELRRIACVFNLLHVSTPLGHPALYMSKPRSDMKSFCWNLLHAQPRPGSKGGLKHFACGKGLAILKRRPRRCFAWRGHPWIMTYLKVGRLAVST